MFEEQPGAATRSRNGARHNVFAGCRHATTRSAVVHGECGRYHRAANSIFAV